MAVDVSVVIPCFNEEKYIGQCIDSLFKETNGLELQILIADGMSTDNTRNEIAKKQATYPGKIQVLDNHKRKTPYALNLGIEHAKGKYTLIASAHSSFDPHYITGIIQVFKEGEYEADIIGGMMETKVLNETPKSLSIVNVLSNKFGVGNSMFRVGVEKPTYVDTVPFGIYKTKLLKTINGYDVRLIRNHDMEMSKRILALGYKILLLPTPKCYYYARETLKGVFQNNFRNGNWNIKTVYITKRFSSLSLRHFIPLIFLLSIILPLLAGLLLPPLSILALISFVLYTLVILSQSIKIYRADSRTSIGYSLLTFMVLHISYGLGSLSGIFSLKYLRV